MSYVVAAAGPMPRTMLIALAGAGVWLLGVLVLGVSLVGTRRPAPRTRAWRAVTRRVRRAARDTAPHGNLLAAGLVCGALAWLVTGLPVTGMTVACMVPGVPWLFQVGRAERDAISRVEAVGDWAQRLQMSSTVGLGLHQAITASAGAAPEVIEDQVRDLSTRLLAGVDARDALLRFADDIGDPGADQVVAALIMHVLDGGDRLDDVLTSVVTATRAEVAARREVYARHTRARLRVRFLTLVTVGTLAYGAVRPEFLHRYGGFDGELVLGAIAGVSVAILVRTRVASQPDRLPRLLGSTGPDASGRAAAP